MSNPNYSPENTELAAWYGIQPAAVDDFIDLALTEASLQDGAVYRDLNPLIWNRIGSHVERMCQEHAEQLAREQAA